MKEYDVKVNGIVHRFQLDEEDAKKLGDNAVESKAAPKPANKARSASNK